MCVQSVTLQQSAAKASVAGETESDRKDDTVAALITKHPGASLRATLEAVCDRPRLFMGDDLAHEDAGCFDAPV